MENDREGMFLRRAHIVRPLTIKFTAFPTFSAALRQRVMNRRIEAVRYFSLCQATTWRRVMAASRMGYVAGAVYLRKNAHMAQGHRFVPP